MPPDPQPPIDETARAVLDGRGLRLDLVDTGDEAALRAWVESDGRGFHEVGLEDALFAALRPSLVRRRLVGVWDDSIAEPALPVGTSAGWSAPLTVPGGSVDAWAISSVSVAATHRRRGVARAMMEAELRTAIGLGLPVAMLTASESTIYGRYGFGAAAQATTLHIDVRRAGWAGPEAPGRVQFVARDQAMRDAVGIFDAERRVTPGAIGFDGVLFERLFGEPHDPAEQRATRFARYDDEAGVPQGVVAFRVAEDQHDFTAHVLTVRHLATATPDAEAALWRFLLAQDLVSEVRAALRSTDEPLRWLVADQRAIRTVEVRDHLWLRVLDPVAALGARTYGGPGRVVLEVVDPDGPAAGALALDVDAEGRAAVERTDASPDLVVPIDLLGALLLGGVTVPTLVRAGRLDERRPGAAEDLDGLLHSPVVPRLGIWF